MVNDVSFSEWLNEQVRLGQWTQAGLARAAGLSASTVHKMLNSKIKQPSTESCRRIAKALEMSTNTVLRAAKISLAEPEFPELDDLKMVVAQLSDQERQEILAFAKVMLEFKKKGDSAVK